MAQIRSWGVVYTEDIERAPGHECPRCGEKTVEMGRWGKELFEFMVGFEATDPSKFIFECPDCHEKFWFHANEALVKYAIKFCPNWPK